MLDTVLTSRLQAKGRVNRKKCPNTILCSSLYCQDLKFVEGKQPEIAKKTAGLKRLLISLTCHYVNNTRMVHETLAACVFGSKI